MNQYAGTQTEKNLQTAFAEESIQRNQYTYFAAVAAKEGYRKLSADLTVSADYEKEHAKLWYEELEGIGDTEKNLETIVNDQERIKRYEDFAKTAEEEGFFNLAEKFRMVGEIEGMYRERYKKFLKDMEKAKVFERSRFHVWECMNCGYLELSSELEICPVCAHPGSIVMSRPINLGEGFMD